MRVVRVHITERFSGDTVELRLNGRVVYQGKNLTSKLLVGFAEEVELSAPRRDCLLEAELVNRGFKAALNLPEGGELDVELRFDGESLEFRLQDEAVGYL